MKTFIKYISIFFVLLTGSVCVTQTHGQPLPFFEPWTQGQFGYQQWTFEPNQGNWVMNTSYGDPVPTADFQSNPVLIGYTSALESTWLDASAYSCADVFCNFDLKLDDNNATGTEKMDMDVLVNGVWINAAEYADSGSFDWSLKHINISEVDGSVFKFRFRASGVSTANINHWYVDNIEVYTVCRPPTSLTGQQHQFTTTLTWQPPTCPAPCNLKTFIYDSGVADSAYSNSTIGVGYELGNYFPATAGASGVIKSVDMYFSSTANTSAQSLIIYFYNSNHAAILGQSAPFINTGAPWPAGTWVNDPVPDIPFTGPFYVMVEYSINALPMKNLLCCDLTSTFPGYPQGYGIVHEDNIWSFAAVQFGEAQATFMLRANICDYGGKDKNSSITTIDPATLVFNVPQSPAGSQLMGYYVWRENVDSLAAGFKLMNHTIVSDTTYLDQHPTNTLPAQHWKYYVTAEYQDSLDPGPPFICEPSSDTISVDFPNVGFNYLTCNQVSLYPNPSTEVVNVVSTDEILSIHVLNYLGQTIYKSAGINQKTTRLSVSSLSPGVYFVNVTTKIGTTTMKITVTH
jgi:hypothetical protein